MTIVHHPSTDRETDAIEHLNFSPPCEYPAHSFCGTGAAVWLVLYRTPRACGCPGPETIYFCDGCWTARCGAPGTHCNACFVRYPSKTINILRVERI